MGTSERRRGIMQMLCRRRSEVIENIAAEFGVSERTARRDVEALSRNYPIYTKAGRHGGGVFVMDGYYIDKMCFSHIQSAVLKKLLCYVENNDNCVLSEQEMTVFRDLITEYSNHDIQ